MAECTVEMIPKPMAKRALNLLKSFDFTIVEDASVGCAVFYAWVSVCSQVPHLFHLGFFGGSLPVL